MAIIRSNEVRELDEPALSGRLTELRKELNAERGMVKSGGRAQNPGRIGELRRTIARVLTIVHETKLGIKRKIRERKKGGAKAAQKKEEAKAAAKKEEAAVPKKDEAKQEKPAAEKAAAPTTESG